MRRPALAGALALAVITTACGNHTSSGFHPNGNATAADPGTTSSTGTDTPNSTNATPDSNASPASATPESALAAYRNYQRVYEQAYENNDSGALNSVAMNPLLSIITTDIRKIKSRSEIWRFHNVLNPKVQGHSSDSSSVVILDCVHTLGAYRYSAKTGARLSSWRSGSHLYQAIMRFTDGTYKISDATQGRPC